MPRLVGIRSATDGMTEILLYDEIGHWGSGVFVAVKAS
jgi:hypothetical protein